MNEKMCVYLQRKVPKWGGFPPLWLSNPNFQFDFDFPNPKKNCGFHRSSDFSFFLLSSRFSESPLSSLIDYITKVRIYFEIRKQNQD